MTANAVLGVFVLPAVFFTLVYFPTVTQLALAVVSPDAKADVRKRLLAAMIDGTAVITAGFFYWKSGAAWILVAAGLYLLLRDSIRGQSLGKFLVGLVVTDDGKSVCYQLPYGAWIRLFRENSFVIEDLVELQAPEDASTTYAGVPETWARKWPAEHIWRLAKIA